MSAPSPEPLLDVAEAERRVRARLPDFGEESVTLAEAAGRTLRQRVVAERDQPPYDRVTMDGIAFRHEAGARRWRIAAAAYAGAPRITLEADDACVEIMTGAVLPGGADTVVPVERVRVNEGFAELEPGYEPEPGQFVHARASDHPRGETLLEPGVSIGAAELAVIASAGLAAVTVGRLPRIAVISTGDELVAPGEPIAAHQIRMSNGPAMVAALALNGLTQATHHHLDDEPGRMRPALERLLAGNDALILSGGVSMGKADHVPAVLAALGVETVFHKVSQRPGKPMWFGAGPRGEPVFALPGNPVSALVCLRRYALPALLAATGAKLPAPQRAALDAPVEFRPRLTWFLPVRLHRDEDGRSLATPSPPNTSGDFTALAGTDGFVELAKETERFPAGSRVPLHRWRMV